MLRCATPEQVVTAVGTLGARVIAVDGFQGSGKTTLARALGADLGLRVFCADHYLHRNQGAFFAHLNLRTLGADLAALDGFVLEGVCCLKVLQAVRRSADCLVYVKRMAIWGWADEDELQAYMSESASSPTEPQDPLAASLNKLWREVAHYHEEFQPHKTAHLVYERRAA